MKTIRTSSRKQQHVEITISKDVAFRAKSTGFDGWEFRHNALPELDAADVDPSVTFLGKKLSVPLMISSMTGGYADAERINGHLAAVCEEFRIALGVGSQRQALESTQFHSTFSVVRRHAKTVPVLGNIGAAEVAGLKDATAVQRLVDLIRADALIVHLNPLQEFLQPEGSPKFRGVLSGIALLASSLQVPVVVKEIGAGISRDVARRLIEAGVRIIDVAGSGGTSWAGVETIRRKKVAGGRTGQDFAASFWDWGIPTSDALRDVSSLKNTTPGLQVISSGGINGGLDIAKSIAFGADLAAAARPLLQSLERDGVEGLLGTLERWTMELKGAMFLTGSATIAGLQQQQLVLKQPGRT